MTSSQVDSGPPDTVPLWQRQSHKNFLPLLSPYLCVMSTLRKSIRATATERSLSWKKKKISLSFVLSSQLEAKC